MDYKDEGSNMDIYEKMVIRAESSSYTNEQGN